MGKRILASTGVLLLLFTFTTSEKVPAAAAVSLPREATSGALESWRTSASAREGLLASNGRISVMERIVHEKPLSIRQTDLVDAEGKLTIRVVNGEGISVYEETLSPGESEPPAEPKPSPSG